MSAYREGSYTWRFCASITVDLRAWAAGAADVQLTMQADFDAFWNGINQTDGRDIRVTNASAQMLSFSLLKAAGGALDATGITNRDLIIRVDGSVTPTGGSDFTPTVAGMYQLFLWWGQSSVSAPTTGYVGVAGAYTAYVLQYLPPHVWVARREPSGALRLTNRMHKTTTESIVVACDVGALLQRRKTPTAGSLRAVEMSYATYAVLLAGAAQAAMVDASTVRFFAGRYVCFLLKAGTTATNYTISLTVTTNTVDALNPRAQLNVRDLAES